MHISNKKLPSLTIPGLLYTIPDLIPADNDAVIDVLDEYEKGLGFACKSLVLVKKVEFTQMNEIKHNYIVELRDGTLRAVICRESVEIIVVRKGFFDKTNEPTYRLNINHVSNLYEVKLQIEYF